jgi:hypothetical protein
MIFHDPRGAPLRNLLLTPMLTLGLLFLSHPSFAAQNSCQVPLHEEQSAPSVDLIQNDLPIDRDQLLDQIKNGFDSSLLEPQLSNIYRGQEQTLIQFAALPYPEKDESVTFANGLPGVDGLVRARVFSDSNPNVFFQMNFSLDAHASLVRNALLRKLGYNIPSPKYYPKLALKFATLKDRDSFLDTLASDTLTSRGRWVSGGIDELNRNQLTLTFQDIVLEPAIITVPQLHWGILTPETLSSRRSLRALLVPLTLLDITESVNMYSYEPAKIFNDGITFSRTHADAFKNETTIGDARWIARKIAALSRQDWMNILHAGHYPADIEALLVEKTIGRVDQLMGLLGIEEFKRIPYDAYLTYGNVLKGKALQEKYDGYALRFTYGDPQSPLHASELIRFFGISTINAALTALIEKGDSYLQFITPNKYITAHTQSLMQDVVNHFQTNPNEPYIQPIESWGGPVIGGRLNASRNIITGTYYGSESKIQLVDTVSAAVSAGSFFGVSGIPRVGISITPTLHYSRNYVHVRPLPDIKTAWKENWLNLLVPKFMFHLSSILAGKASDSASDSVKAFMDQLAPGEIFIITDGFSGGGSVNAQIPLGAMIGFLPSFGTLTGSATVAGNYGILSRTTLVRTKDGFQVYLSRINSKTFEMDLNAQFFIKVIGASEMALGGSAHTRAFVMPEKFDDEAKAKSFRSALRAILRTNNPEILEEEFNPYQIDHRASGNRFAFNLGPFSWVTRLNFHRLEITPPIDKEGRYQATDYKRTVIDGQITKTSGTNLYGFLGGLLKIINPIISIGGDTKGDDPSSSFLGSSRSFTTSAQLETTPSRENHTFVKLQESYSGWSMRKNRLLRIIGRLSNQLREFNPKSGLINPSEFSQTRKIQSYNVVWSFLIYENGLNRLLSLLDLNATSTLTAQQTLISVVGKSEYETYCSDQDLEAKVYRGPVVFEDQEPGDGTYTESSQGQTLTLGCVTPFMQTIYDLRSSLQSHPEIFAYQIHDEQAAKEKIRYLNKTMVDLHRDLELSQIIRLIGKENAFFQVRVSGFRTKDENGDSEYFSNTIGDIDTETLAGPLSDIQSGSQISSNEIEGRYLSNGY